jgi:O-methyltransferase
MKLFPDHCRLLIARCLFSAGFPGHAFSILDKLKAERCRLRGIDLLRAQCRLRQNLRVEAREMVKEELRLHPENKSALAMLGKLTASPPDSIPEAEPEFLALLEKIEPYSMVGRARLHALYRAALDVCRRDLPGNFAECGVAGGGSSALLAYVIKQHSKRERRLYAFDTFEGMPEPTAEDTHGGTDARCSGWADGTCAAPVESVLRAAAELQAGDIVVPVKGLFAETLPRMRGEMGTLCFLHLDGDWYDSTMDILVNLFDQVVPGGYLQVDDYGYWDGCRRAVHEFEAKRGLVFSINEIDATGVWFRKAEA